ncbi:response regulator transcription factor [Vagococcus coleopterorum]|uniref:Response regulator transcription factor n=1 Tax=Vagococcus coleopterorum TaxID=2714946 RepID=A0A6G8ANC6_9ENTE|nr:response regulator transcription factor [Vagococcus coleopterorum]QIL46469.1 response regulator transcription factor [Vagococcus coleopterorum]
MAILIIEDEPAIAKLLEYNLAQAGFNTTVCQDGLAGFEEAQAKDYQCLLVDLMLPSMTGLEIIKELRHLKNYTPIVMLTAKDNEVDKVMALELGADDYITKPFSPRELEARLKAVIRRDELRSDKSVASPVATKEVLRCGTLALNTKNYQVTLDGELLDLTKTQFTILSYMMKNKGLIISRDQLIDGLGMLELSGGTRSIDMHMGKLREKIEENPKEPRYLKTIRGFGYRLEDGEHETK